MKKKLIIRYILPAAFCLFAIFIMASCRKFIEIPPPINSIITTEVFADSTDATAAINGIYINMMNRYGASTMANSTTSICGSLAADELDNSLIITSYKEIFLNGITITNSNVLNIWTTSYAFIYQANACIDGATKSTTISNTLKNRIIGESKFIRAYVNFYLVNLFGPVPLAITIDYKLNGLLPRANVAEVYTQINADLKDAQTLLANDPVAINTARINRFAVSAFLARVNLYQQQWAAAESAATTVISAPYKLEPNLNNVFLIGNQEQIWQMPPIGVGDETTEAGLTIPFSATSAPNFIVVNSLLNAFETNDKRKTAWTNTSTVGTNKYTYPYKYKLRMDLAIPSKEGYSMLRLAEQYLIRAEARAQQNNLAGAIADINIIRTRAGLANTTAATQTAVLVAIKQERRIELFCEWGHRWLDLKRTNTIDAVLNSNKTGWKPTAALFPIPFSQTQLNPQLTQNPGY